MLTYFIPGTSVFSKPKLRKYVQPVATGALNADDSNSCCVRAMANTHPSISLMEAAEIAKNFGRVKGEGMEPQQYFPMFTKNGYELIGVFGDSYNARYMKKYLTKHYLDTYNNQIMFPKFNAAVSLKKAVEKFNEGSYIFIIKGHAIACVDGDIIDTHASPAGSRVFCVFKLID